MKYLVFLLLLLSQIFVSAQKKEYYKGGEKIDPLLIEEKVTDSAAKKVNTIFLFRNDNRSHFIKILNLAGKTYGQAVSEYVTLDFNSKRGGDLHRKVEELTNIKIENSQLISDQLLVSFVYLKEKGVNHENMMPPLKLMICSEKNNKVTCKLSEDDIQILPEEISGLYPYTAFTRLGYGDLKGIKPKNLDIMKKEIHARYGYSFEDANDNAYFYTQNWYEPIVDNRLIELNELEKDNIAMITLMQGQLNKAESLNRKSYNSTLSIENTANLPYSVPGLKNMKYIKQDSLSGNKCVLSEYSKTGILSYKQDCMISKSITQNYFNSDYLVQSIDQQRDTFFYYNDVGLPYKSVKLDYDTETTETSYFTYDNDNNITKKDIYHNNNFNNTMYYSYDSENNMIREFYKDDDGKEANPIKYFYDEENIYTGYLRSDDFGCDYFYNDPKDVITEIECYSIDKDNVRNLRSKTKREILELIRGKNRRLQSLKLYEFESYKYSLSLTEFKYY